MGSLGTIGSINAEFTASTSNFSASVKEVGASLEATGAKAQAAGEKTAAGIRAMTTSAERARQAWQRELVQQGRAAQAAADSAQANELAALKADILSRSNEILARSADVTATSFERMSASVRSSVTAMGEKITAIAERAELSADGIAAGFGGLGKLLGVGLLGDFVAHALDNIAELNVMLGDLHEKTGIAVQDLAGLRLMALSKGLDFTTLSMGLIRLGKAMYEAKQGMQEDREAFSSLGISMQEVNSLSIEQMFYRISEAIGQNRDLVISDGTALELFGRGGKEVVPVLREWGGSLEAIAKRQGALTGVTEESVSASQKWLQATTDLSAEFHAGLIPVLIDLVKLIEPVKAGWHALEVGTEMVFGTIINSAVAVVESIGDIGKAIKDLAAWHPSDALQDVKNTWTANQKGWQLQQGHIQSSSLAGMNAWNQMVGGSGLVHPFEPGGKNQAGDVDGDLLKQAKQALATMEEQKPLSHQQLIDYWKQILAKAQKGSSDYEQVNLVLGSLMEHSSAKGAGGQGGAQSAIVGQWKQQLDEEKSAQEMTLQQELDFWLQRAEFAKRGSASYAAAMDESNKVAIRMQSENTKALREFDALGGGPIQLSDTPEQAKTRAGANADFEKQGNLLDSSTKVGDENLSALREQGRAWADALKSMNAYISAEGRAKSSIAEAALQMAVATGQMSKLDAAQMQARLHTQEFGAAWDKLQSALANVQSLPDGAEKQKRLYDLRAQSTQMQGERTIQIMQDTQAISDQTVSGATMQALNQMVQAWEDMAAQIKSVMTRTADGLNDDIVKAMTGHGKKGDFGKTFQQAGQGLMKTGLQGAEGSLLQFLSKGKIGPKRDGSSANAALWVQMTSPGVKLPASSPGGSQSVPGQGSPSPISGIVGHIFGGAQPGLNDQMVGKRPGGWQSFLNPIIGAALGAFTKHGSVGAGSAVTGASSGSISGGSNWLMNPFQGAFAGGGGVLANRPALVGEEGPEMFMPRAAGRIIPNHQLGGETHNHHYSVDARGATDPAAVHAAVARALPHAVAASVQAVHERSKRIPQGR